MDGSAAEKKHQILNENLSCTIW